jgi:hypothetical protein
VRACDGDGDAVRRVPGRLPPLRQYSKFQLCADVRNDGSEMEGSVLARIHESICTSES